uniref:Tyrosine specific protein phosphatases domain-containing protein n=1 Tax=Rhizophora mucronata TaxID=61149 RepID=A0A2P2IP15_RHIMU
MTYVHCKAGRGRSTTIVLCYLVEHKDMTPNAAYNYVRSIRPRVLLASSQWQAVKDYYLFKVKKTEKPRSMIVQQTSDLLSKVDTKQDSATFDDGFVVVVTESDLDGYDACESGVVNSTVAELSLACKFASQMAISRLSRFWLRCHVEQKCSRKKLEGSDGTEQLSSLSVDIEVY